MVTLSLSVSFKSRASSGCVLYTESRIVQVQPSIETFALLPQTSQAVWISDGLMNPRLLVLLLREFRIRAKYLMTTEFDKLYIMEKIL